MGSVIWPLLLCMYVLTLTSEKNLSSKFYSSPYGWQHNNDIKESGIYSVGEANIPQQRMPSAAGHGWPESSDGILNHEHNPCTQRHGKMICQHSPGPGNKHQRYYHNLSHCGTHHITNSAGSMVLLMWEPLLIAAHSTHCWPQTHLFYSQAGARR